MASFVKFGEYDTIEGVTIYADAKEFETFYLLPQQPSFRVDDKGEPIFSFFKYKHNIDRADGKKGGGYVIFDVEFTVPDAKLPKIIEKLQAAVNVEARKRHIAVPPVVKIASISYNKGTARLNMQKDGVFVERIFDAGKPSMYGKNISTFTLELTPEGATFFEQALQGKGGAIQIVYDLHFDVQLPPVTITGEFHARSFYQFVQQIDVNQPWCSSDDYKETLSELIHKSESTKFKVDPAGTQVDKKTMEALEAWARQHMDSAVERLALKELHMEDPEAGRKWFTEKGINHVKKDVMKTQVSDYDFKYEGVQYKEDSKSPQGTLPNITNMVNKEGKPIKWEDHAKLIDLNDPFFQQINIAASVNGSFDELPIHSVALKLSYNGQPMDVLGSPIDGEFLFTSPNEKARFASFKEKGIDKYKYSYEVNYKGTSKIFKSPEVEADSGKTQLVVGVDDIGILLVDILPGDINFNEITQVQVVVQYEDKANGVNLLERQFIISKDNPAHSLKQVIFAPRSKPYKYKCKFFMKNNKEYVEDWKEGNSNKLYINDPFQGERTVRVVAISDFTTDVTSIMADFKYQDKEHKYEQTVSVVLNERQPFFDWVFPVIDQSSEVGVVSYSGTILNKNGTVKQIPSTIDNAPSIMVGDKNPDILKVQVFADLIDFDTTVKMVKLSLKYKDDKNSILLKKDLVFGKDKPMQQNWGVKLADKTKIDYEWSATYFMIVGSKMTTKPASVDDEVLMLETPEDVVNQIIPSSIAFKRALVKERATKLAAKKSMVKMVV